MADDDIRKAVQDDGPDFPEKLTAEEAKAAWERLIAEADKRGGTPRGAIVPDVVDGRRLS
jgi:hypothetical protein